MLTWRTKLLVLLMLAAAVAGLGGFAEGLEPGNWIDGWSWDELGAPVSSE